MSVNFFQLKIMHTLVKVLDVGGHEWIGWTISQREIIYLELHETEDIGLPLAIHLANHD